MKRLIAAAVCILIALGGVLTCSSASAEQPPAAPEKKKSKKKPTPSSTDPLYSLTLMRQGVVLMEQGRYDAALERFNEADRVAPGNATNANMIGLCYLRKGELDKAFAYFDTALILVPLFSDARNNRGTTYLAMGQYHLAEVDFVAVLGDSTYPHAKQVNYNLGLTYLERGQLGAAEDSFRRSIILPDPVFDGYLKLAALAQRQGELERSIVLLEEAKLNFPEAIEVSFELGKVLTLMGRDDEARPYLEQVIADEPSSQAAASARALLGVS
jgi:tetratricopeptide (TPR) repeat protein